MYPHTTATTLYDDDLQTLIRACMDDPVLAGDVLRCLDLAMTPQLDDIECAKALTSATGATLAQQPETADAWLRRMRLEWAEVTLPARSTTIHGNTEK
ncbi:MAG TPA: hypothetical protein VND88_09655 [Candidatus Acidoferrales bacterium]|nr:hypothetical protein [Candidatus Acidoferrales bacterium]